ncbi:MAG TPA: TonB-dependent receptor [Candidatus Babeliales bacterium]|nr:TonB-dependent receptor [Candidatus Babeliales bacterium]
MRSHRTLRHAVIAASLTVAFLFQGTWALAATTGNIAGTVKDTSGAPIAGVRIEAVAPSQTATATTDAGGHFVILSLAPDTYTLSLSKSGYQPVSFPGVVVFADQTQQVAYTLQQALKQIAHVTSQAGSSLVKSGVGGDLYSVNATQAAAAAALGGGGNLNNAYSAMASVPGIQTSMGGMGWDFNAAYVRGQNSYYTGYEYDGIPVNRAFDNYNSSTESSLGLQELQVYTGGGPSSTATAGTAGFINQVIKTGTFPGFATANLGIGSPTFYHQAQVEIGGSTPDRTFSYYVGLLGYNQDYRTIDNSNGAGYGTPGGIFSGDPDGFAIGYGFGSDQVLATGYTCLIGTCQGVKPMCPLVGAPWSNQPVATIGQQGCWQYYAGVSADPLMISDRENVINLHMGIPKSNGLRDDVQLLWSGSALNNYFYNDQNSIGPGYQQFNYSLYGTLYKSPTCTPTAVGPGLTIPVCSSFGQIIPLQSLYTCGVTPPSAPGLACGPTYLPYADSIAYNVPFGTPIGTWNYKTTSAPSIATPGVYMAPDTPAHAFDGAQPLSQSLASNENDTGITKLQYTYALSQAAYLRAYAYTFYSDWLELGPMYGGTDGYAPSSTAAQYQLITHTSGGALSFQDQLNDQNLVTLDGNYSTAGVIRFNNYSAYAGCLGLCSDGSPTGYMALGATGYTCYGDAISGPDAGKFGYSVPCLYGSAYDTNLSGTTTKGGTYNCAVASAPECTVAPTWVSGAESTPAFAAPGTPAAIAKATWDSIWNSNATGSYNTVRPRFTNASLQDQFRPSDKFLINAAIRYDNFTYDLPDSVNAADSFYAYMTSNYTCVYAATNQVLTTPLLPGQPPPAAAQYVIGNCDQAAAALHPSGPHTGWVHPNGTVQNGITAPNFSASSPGSYTLNYWEPRVSATYTQSPDVVWRLSAGRFTQPPISASVQYLSLSGDDRSVWNNTMNLGFYSPFHPIPGISSGQYDLSYEQHFRGTDMSIKLTPFYTWVNGWQQQTFIGSGFVTQVPVGVNRNEGLEMQFNKGDFSRNGWSGQVAFTYTNSKVMFENWPLITGGTIPNTTTALNQVIAAYNALTKAGGGSPCYQAGTAVPCSEPNGKIVAGYDTILNPYYNLPQQGLLNPSGWYNPYSTAIAPNLNGAVGSYISPYVASLIANWRENKLAVTPSIVFQSGGYYGSPLDTEGLDPRSCVENSLATGITKLSPKTNPLQCNYLTTTSAGTGPFTYLYVPDPQTGTFLFDNVEQPNQIVGNLQIAYNVSPRVTLSVLGANLFHVCFGGTAEPWTSANPPSNVICGYSPAGGSLNSTLYPSNFYNGLSIYDRAANKASTPWTQSYLPSNLNNGAIGGGVPPINVYFNAQIKI